MAVFDDEAQNTCNKHAARERRRFIRFFVLTVPQTGVMFNFGTPKPFSSRSARATHPAAGRT